MSSEAPTDLASQFLLRPDITFLNHGSYGACPRPVFEVYQAWQRDLEADPVDFFTRQARPRLAEARARLAAFVGASPDEIMFVRNTSLGMTMLAQAFELEPGDEVLTTNHEYGTVEQAWRQACLRQQARYVIQPIALPVGSADELVAQLWAGVTPRTRVILVSHITAFTTLIFPVAEICRRARAAGILTIIDGAHALGQIDIDLGALGADFYVASCHKWLCAPKGAGFLYAWHGTAAASRLAVPGTGPRDTSGGPLSALARFEWLGTQDLAAYLSVPAAIDFQAQHNWPQVQAACHQLLAEARGRIGALTGLPQLYPDSDQWYRQMVAVMLPASPESSAWLRLWDEFQIEIPIIVWGGQQYIRISIQAYNRPRDIDLLVSALAKLL